MRIQCVEILNYRRLKSTHIDFDKESTENVAIVPH
jgi:hypothetical protein